MQNAATRLVSQDSHAHCHDHITPVLTSPWLPVCKRVMFKTAVLVWKCLNGTTPGYLSDLCVPAASASGRQHLRSASMDLKVPRAWTMIGRQSYKFPEPEPWSAGGASMSRGRLCGTVFQLLSTDRRWQCTLSSDNSRPICSTSAVPTNRRNMYHRPAPLWYFSWFSHQIQNCRLTYLLT